MLLELNGTGISNKTTPEYKIAMGEIRWKKLDGDPEHFALYGRAI